MRDLFLDQLCLAQLLEPNADGGPKLLAELLFFPELCSLGHDGAKLREALGKLAQGWVEEAEGEDFARRLPQFPLEAIETGTLALVLEPPRRGKSLRNPAWLEPLRLEFPYLRAPLPDGAAFACFPSLGIEVVASRAEALEGMLEEHVAAALARAKATASLGELALLQRSREIRLEPFRWNAYPLSPGERAERLAFGEQSRSKALPEVAERLNASAVEALWEREADLERLRRALSGRKPTSVLLVGEPGVGKTALARSLGGAGRLGGRPVYATSGSRIVAGMCGFGDWQERCRRIAKEASEEGAILLFGNLFELSQVGASSGSSENVASFFRPAMLRGELLAVAECTPAQVARIEARDPRLLEPFRQLKVEPSTEEETRRILAGVAKEGAGGPFESAALDRVVALHRRYAGYSARPGRAIRFTKRLAERRRRGLRDSRGSRGPGKEKQSAAASPLLGRAEVDLAFAAETGLPLFLLDEAQPFAAATVSAWFRERLLGQEEAVERVVDAVAAAKAGLSRPGRPLASFLFVGPTGVGKTELAKAVAEFFFGSRERLVRFDMSEFAAPGSGERLVASGAGGSGEGEEGLLTAALRDQPFSVLLLDEFEKADGSVHDLFLQVLGEARLTDAAGRLADFSNAVVILTSNLGASEFRARRPGFHDPAEGAAALAKEHFTEAAKRAFRPEFFNRIERIVPFLPLSREAVEAVVRREVRLAERRDGLRLRNASLLIEDAAVRRLAELGYDPRYGARPVKRALEQRLLRAVAEDLAARPERRDGFFEVATIPDEGPPPLRWIPASEEARRSGSGAEAFWLERAAELRRLYQRLASSWCVAEVEEARRFMRRTAGNLSQGKGEDTRRPARVEEVLERLEREREAALRCEEALLLAELRDAPAAERAAARLGAPDRAAFDATLLAIYGEAVRTGEKVVLCVQADSAAALARYAPALFDAAEAMGMKARAAAWPRRPDRAREQPKAPGNEAAPPRYRPEAARAGEEARRLVADPPEGTAALALELAGPIAQLLFSAEEGVHLFIDPDGDKQRVLVSEVAEVAALEDACLDLEFLLERDWRDRPQRRRWDELHGGTMRLRDAVLTPERHEGKLPDSLSPETLRFLVEQAAVARALDSL